VQSILIYLIRKHLEILPQYLQPLFNPTKKGVRSVKIYDSPDKYSGTIIATMKDSQTVEVLSEHIIDNTLYYQIRFGDGKIGWCEIFD